MLWMQKMQIRTSAFTQSNIQKTALCFGRCFFLTFLMICDMMNSKKKGSDGMKIRLADMSDLDEILRVYRTAKAYMDRTGNATQWEVGYPSRELICEDIDARNLYVITEQNTVHAVFFFKIGEDETYINIYEGAWKNQAPYGVIHRVGSDGALRGIMQAVVAFCRQRIGNLRIDTHENNQTMQYVLEKIGFLRCGIIYLPDGAPRIAYEL